MGSMFTSHGGHSADVRISLMFRGHSIPVAQLRADFLLLDAPADHPPGPASILLRVDQSEQRWDVRLPNGISATSKRVAASHPAPPSSKLAKPMLTRLHYDECTSQLRFAVGPEHPAQFRVRGGQSGWISTQQDNAFS